MPQGIAEQLRIRLRVKLRELRQSGGGLLPSVRIFAFGARRIVPQDADGLRDVAPLNQVVDVGLNILRRDAPGFVREKNCTLATLRDGGPELTIENFAM